MVQHTFRPLREDVLDAFAVEPEAGRSTLERYLRSYPEYAAEILDLSRELSRGACEDESPLSTTDQVLIDTAWQRHLKAVPIMVADPLASLTMAELREVALRLDVPRQVITAFRERRVILATVSRSFLERFAAAVNSTIDVLVSALALPSEPGSARSYKSDEKPRATASVTFEQLLLDAGVSAEKRTLLMMDDGH